MKKLTDEEKHKRRWERNERNREKAREERSRRPKNLGIKKYTPHTTHYPQYEEKPSKITQGHFGDNVSNDGKHKRDSYRVRAQSWRYDQELMDVQAHGRVGVRKAKRARYDAALGKRRVHWSVYNETKKKRVRP